ncbi:MAG: glycosyltransferase [Ruminococcaceae bacterium]|nr:glycosyltransferase [Oscillospiraceae bacterium]
MPEKKLSVEVLCATMFQKDFSKIEEMNIKTDVFFANQSSEHFYAEKEFNGYLARMVTTNQRGLSKNRNTALIYAKGDICVIADDDVEYFDDYEQKIVSAFEALPDADIIMFNLSSKNGNSERAMKEYSKIKKVGKLSRCGTASYRIAFKLSSVQKANIWFSPIFSTGSKYYCGEDAMWINDAIKKGLKVYTYPEYIASIDYGNSTWYDGLLEKHYFTKGAYIKALYGKLCICYIPYYLIRASKRSKLSFTERLKWILNGVKAYNADLSYDEFIDKN